MNITRRTADLLGILTLLPLVLSVALLICVALITVGSSGALLSTVVWVRLAVVSLAVMMVILVAVYVSLALGYPAVRHYSRAIWVVMIILGTFAGMAAFWIVHLGRGLNVRRKSP